MGGSSIDRSIIIFHNRPHYHHHHHFIIIVITLFLATQMSRLKGSLVHLKKTYEVVHGEPSNLPSDDEVGLRKFANGVTLTDNANAAVKVGVELAKIVAQEMEEYLGPERWAALSVEEREKLCKVWSAHCQRHLGNTFLDGGCAEEKKYLLSVLKDCLAEDGSKRLR